MFMPFSSHRHLVVRVLSKGMDLGLANPPVSLPFLDTCLLPFVGKATPAEAGGLLGELEGKVEKAGVQLDGDEVGKPGGGGEGG